MVKMQPRPAVVGWLRNRVRRTLCLALTISDSTSTKRRLVSVSRRKRNHCRGRDDSSLAAKASRLGQGATAALDGSDGSDLLKPLAQTLKVAHPPMLKAIAAAKKKNDKVDARMIADLLRCNLLPECYMAPVMIRDLRRMLRYRNLVVRQTTRMKNRIAGLLMETGTAYNKGRLHGKAYFNELLDEMRRSIPEGRYSMGEQTHS